MTLLCLNKKYIEKIRTYNKIHQLKHSICCKLQYCFSLHVQFSTIKKHSTKVTVTQYSVDVSIASQHYILITKVGEQWCLGLVQLKGTCKIWITKTELWTTYYIQFFYKEKNCLFFYENRNWIHTQISFCFVGEKEKEKENIHTWRWGLCWGRD